MKNKILILFIAFIAMIGITVQAKTSTVTADDVVSFNERVNGTSIVAGNDVKVSSFVDGLSFIAGNNVTISSDQDYLFAAGNNVVIENMATKDAFVAGATVKVESSTIRDLYVAGQSITINSDISRNLNAAGESVTINSRINGDLYIDAENIKLSDSAVVIGTLKYPEDANIEISDNAQINKTSTYEGTKIDTKTTIVNKVTNTLSSYLGMLVIGLLLLRLNKKVFDRFANVEKDGSNIIKITLFGLLLLIGVPIVAFILIFIPMTMPLSIVTLIVYGLVFYLSALPTAYFVGKWGLGDRIENDYLLLTISLLVLYLLKLVPILGGWIEFLSLCFGLGVYFNTFRNIMRDKN